MDYKEEKKMAIVDSIVNTTNSISSAAKELPNIGKKRNIFIKTYDRRPMNKKKKALAMFKMGFSAYMGAVNITRIMSQPIPKFPKGGV